MTPMERFLAYAEAFEATYEDDDWTRLEPFCAPDLVYRVVGSPSWDCVVEGRTQVFAAIRRFLDRFDRRYARTLIPGAVLSVTDEAVHVSGSAEYRLGDSDALSLEIELLTEFRDGRIVRLNDIYPPGQAERTRAWIARFGGDLNPSYTALSGSCLCGAVGYEIEGALGPIGHCHCRTCQKAHAAAYATTARVDRTAFRWTRGGDSVASFESTPGKQRYFCPRCGSHLIAAWEDQPQVIVRVGSLDGDPGARPVAHIWTSHSAAWLEDGDALPRFAEGVPA